jgi:RNA polymerase sigma-70 factor (ECF subfamily)
MSRSWPSSHALTGNHCHKSVEVFVYRAVREGDRSDAELVRALRREPQAVGTLYDRYALRLVRCLKQEGADEDVALDAAQEVFARLIVHRRRVRPGADGSVWPWLVVTGRNLLRDWQRRRAVDAKARIRLGIAVTSDEATEALARVQASRLRQRLGLALNQLPSEQRAAVTARVVNELDYAEIASAAGTSEAAVRRRVSRGLRAMQAFLQGGDS